MDVLESFFSERVGPIGATLLELCARGEAYVYGGMGEGAFALQQCLAGQPVHKSHLDRSQKDLDLRVNGLIPCELVEALRTHGWARRGAGFDVRLAYRGPGAAPLRVAAYVHPRHAVFIEIAEGQSGQDPAPAGLTTHEACIYALSVTADSNFAVVLGALGAAGAGGGGPAPAPLEDTALAASPLAFYTPRPSRGLQSPLSTGHGSLQFLELIKLGAQGGVGDAEPLTAARMAERLRAVVLLTRLVARFGSRADATALRGGSTRGALLERLTHLLQAGAPAPHCGACHGAKPGALERVAEGTASGGGPAYIHAACRTEALPPGAARRRARWAEAWQQEARLEALLQLRRGGARGLPKILARLMGRTSHCHVVECDAAFSEMPALLVGAAEDAAHPLRGYLDALGVTPALCRELAAALAAPPPRVRHCPLPRHAGARAGGQVAQREASSGPGKLRARDGRAAAGCGAGAGAPRGGGRGCRAAPGGPRRRAAHPHRAL